MNTYIRKSIIAIALLILVSCNNSFDNNIKKDNIKIKGIDEVVEVLRDKWGVNHIYAKNQNDLFFSQGYLAAKDRLFQFEIWRRQATGTVAEILGKSELKRDIGTRLFKYRGDIEVELNHYHPQGSEIIKAYVNGVNTYIEEVKKNPESLPLPFKILGITPEPWTPEVVISRHQGLLGNIGSELQIGRAVAAIGAKEVKKLLWLHPQDPLLKLDAKIDKDLLFEDILEPYFSFRKPLLYRDNAIKKEFTSSQLANNFLEIKEDSLAIGSNNWVVSGTKTSNGNTYMANDPHRKIAVPSLRYMAHLVSPQWNVIGGGEPEIPGISIGHNNYGAWGLTVFRTDGEDLYQYNLNPDNHLEYMFNGKWKKMTTITEVVNIKGQNPKEVKLNYTHHGPVTYINKEKNIAFGVKCAWLEPGGSPYLASLRMDQSKTWEEFREACNFSNIPGENMIWADTKGNIGWQAVGIAPIRNGFSGLVPIPGDGSYEWDGYLPIIEKPNEFNPKKGFIATANQNVTSENYKNWNAIGYSWSDPYRGDRVNEVLNNDNDLNMEKMKKLQVDVMSLPAKILVPFLKLIPFNENENEIINRLFNWDFRLTSNSVAATIYVSWENEIKKQAFNNFVPEKGKKYITSIQLKKIIDWIQNPTKDFFGSNPITGRNKFLKKSFLKSIENLKTRLGENIEGWNYGQEKFKHIQINHALGKIVDQETASKLNLGPLPRGGNAYTPGSTGGNLNQSSGASFRMIVNTGDWDDAVATNTPGQSGNPESPFYSNLFSDWAKDKYFPIYYSKEKIKSVTFKQTFLTPSAVKLLIHKIIN